MKRLNWKLYVSLMGYCQTSYTSLEMIEEQGPAIGKPYTAPLGDKLFEIRAKGKEGIGRSLFCHVKGKEIIILNSFIKKTQKAPKREIDKARKRMKEL